MANGTDEPIPIGSMLPLTGPSSADGIEFGNGVTLAIEEINAAGGILGRRLRPVHVDTGRQNSEYEPIADAGIIYIHHNTLLQHHDTVMSDPERYFGCFMGDPADYWYGQGFIKFISWLRDTGQWKPDNSRIAIISGSKPY